MAKSPIPPFYDVVTRRLLKFVNPSKYRANANYFDLLNDDPLVGLAADNNTKVNIIKVSATDVPTVPGNLAVTGDVTIDGSLSVTGATITTGTISETITMATDKKVQFRDTGLYINSGADGKLTISADGSGADDITLSGTVTVADTLTMAAAKAIAMSAAGFTMAAIARTATADGTGTGTIASGPTLQFVTVTAGGDANAIIVLPAPTPGTIVILHVAATGYELRTSDPATIGINGGTGASAESAIGANTTVLMICATATSWKGLQLGSDGTLAKVEVAA